jgi:membrane protease YdiL (CAAX protease family)
LNPAIIDHILFVAIAGALPVAVVMQSNARAESEGIARIPTYALSCAALMIPLMAIVLAWLGQGRPLAGLGVQLATGPWHAVAIAVALAVMGAGIALVAVTKFSHAVRRRVAPWVADSTEGALAQLLPVTRRELAVFCAIIPPSALAEEIVFRAYLIWYLDAVLPLPAAIIVSSLVFGICHSYQGAEGVLKTAAVGVLLAVLYVASGAIWVPLIAHVAVNMTTSSLVWITREQRAEKDE